MHFLRLGVVLIVYALVLGIYIYMYIYFELDARLDMWMFEYFEFRDP